MKRMMILLIVLCGQCFGHIGVVFPADTALSRTYPHILVDIDVDRDNGDADNPITVSASCTITDLSESRAKSEVSSSVTMECLGKKGAKLHNYDGFGQIKGVADKNTTRGSSVGVSRGTLADGQVYIMDADGTPKYIELDQIQYYIDNHAEENAGEIRVPDDTSAIYYTAAAKIGIVSETGFSILGFRLFGRNAQTMNLSDSAAIEKTKEDPNGDGNYTDDEIEGLFDPYAAASGQAINAASTTVESAEANTDMENDNAQQGNQQAQEIYAPDPSTPDPSPAPDPLYSLSSSDGSYTAEAGTGHEANFTTDQAYSSVYWYVKSPSESGLGTNVDTDYGDSSTTTTAQLSYSFPSGVSGDYVITAYVYGGDNSTYQTSYTVTVSLPSSSTSTASPPSSSTSTASPASVSPASGSYYATPGHSHTANFSASSAYSSVYWYVKSPSESGYGRNVETDFGDGNTTTASMTYTFPSDVSGDYVITAYVYDGDGTTIYEVSYTVIVSND